MTAAGEPLAPPDTLPAEAAAVWRELAPFAHEAGTLRPATGYQFGLLCRNIVLEQEMADDPQRRGESGHRGIITRIDAELARFSLAPMGRPIAEAVPTEPDPFAEFDEPIPWRPRTPSQ